MTISNSLKSIDNLESEKIITEGISSIIIPNNSTVFYNPIQEFNRDLSVLAVYAWSTVRTLKNELYILDALSASGLRAIRYAQQIPKTKHIIANDISPSAATLIRRNIIENNLDENYIKISINDATKLLYTSDISFDVIDLDPYGSAMPFLDAAIQNISDGGLLEITCTDTAVLCGANISACFSRYSAIPHHTEYGHESAIRIILSSVNNIAAKYKKYISPLLSSKIDFYIRIFVVVKTSPQLALDSVKNQGLVFTCKECKSFYPHPLVDKNNSNRITLTNISRTSSMTSCKICDGSLYIAGPLWINDLHDKDFIKSMLTILEDKKLKLGTENRLRGFLTLLDEEIASPLFLCIDKAVSKLKMQMPPLNLFKSAYINKGYEISISHIKPLGIKSNAPIEFFWQVLYAYSLTTKPVNLSSLSKRIFTKYDKNVDISFEYNEKIKSKSTNYCRFPQHPHGWGPMARAKPIQNLDQK